MTNKPNGMTAAAMRGELGDWRLNHVGACGHAWSLMGRPIVDGQIQAGDCPTCAGGFPPNLGELMASRYGTGPDDFSEAEPVEAVGPAGAAFSNRLRDRACTCHPSEAPVPCQHGHALSVCLAATVGSIRAERDAALARAEAAESALKLMAADARDAWTNVRGAMEVIAELRQRLAALEPKPEPVHNPFHAYITDRWRIGS